VDRVKLRGMIVLLALAASLVLPATAAAIDRTITVKGEAVQEVVNDAAELGFSVSKERKSKSAALRIVAIRMQAVIATIKATPGVGSSDVSTGEISVRKLTRNGKAIWRASEGVGVVLHQPERAGELVSAAVAAGATGTRGPRFFSSHPETAYNDALLAAFDQAKAKAAALAARAGAILGPVLTIEEGREVVPETSAPRGEKKGPRGLAPPVEPGTSTVTATVRVVFALE
jgi:uncharacterized protein